MICRTWNVPWQGHLITVEGTEYRLILRFDGVKVDSAWSERRLMYQFKRSIYKTACAHEVRRGALFCPICGIEIELVSVISPILVTCDFRRLQVYADAECILDERFH
jgi:hypothetical protein